MPEGSGSTGIRLPASTATIGGLTYGTTITTIDTKPVLTPSVADYSEVDNLRERIAVLEELVLELAKKMGIDS